MQEVGALGTWVAAPVVGAAAAAVAVEGLAWDPQQVAVLPTTLLPLQVESETQGEREGM
jgi:hypothetical protein